MLFSLNFYVFQDSLQVSSVPKKPSVSYFCLPLLGIHLDIQSPRIYFQYRTSIALIARKTAKKGICLYFSPLLAEFLKWRLDLSILTSQCQLKLVHQMSESLEYKVMYRDLLSVFKDFTIQWKSLLNK